MKKALLIIAVTLLAANSYAQEYNWAAGVRLGGEMSGVTLKYNLSATSTLEGILSIPYDDGCIATGLYERNIPVISDGFKFYYGIGGHIGAWGHYDRFRLGIDAIAGLEYKISGIPLAISIDYKPSFDIINDADFHMVDFGLGIKYTF